MICSISLIFEANSFEVTSHSLTHNFSTNCSSPPGTGDGVAVPGTSLSPTTAASNLKANLYYMPSTYHHVTGGAIGPASRDMILWNSNTTQSFTVSGGDSETRPVNVYFHYIIKTANEVLMPVGAVIPYAGSDDYSPDEPTWLACNGNSYKSALSNYKNLFAVIAHRFTDTVGAANFQVPNLTGIFIRGLDSGRGKDPDAQKREAAPDGTTGAHVGTLQKYGTSAADFKITIPHFPPGRTLGAFAVQGNDNLHDANRTSTVSFSGGVSQSRPKNASVQFYIHALHDDKSPSDGFPVGGIIAVPGSGTPDPAIWAVADGTAVPRAGQYAELWAITTLSSSTTTTTTAWGNPDELTFNLPNLTGRCLRATDTRNMGVEDTYGDPDRFVRTAAAPGGTAVGTGSVQDSGTGRPQNAFNVDFDYPTDVVANAAAVAGVDISDFNTATQSFAFQTSATETSPTGVSVRFFVKYASGGSD